MEQISEAGSQEAITICQTSENGKGWAKMYVFGLKCEGGKEEKGISIDGQFLA